MLDLQQIRKAVRSATSRSLVLIDEFGKGTNVHDGVGIFVGVIEHFEGRREECPIVFCVTHFHGTLVDPCIYDSNYELNFVYI
jgi:DNA mismatch repair protein MSH5